MNDHRPSVSIVIVNFNAGYFLVECINKVLPQVGCVVVVDNASTDSSLEMCSQHFSNEHALKIIRNNMNLGFAAACNIGSRQAGGDFVLFLNPDCNLDATAVSRLLQILESDNSAGMAGGLLVNPDGSEQGGGRRSIPTPWRAFVRAFGLYRFANYWPELFFDFHLHKQPLPTGPIEVEAISGACMLVKRVAIEDVGLWDEGYFLHCEDLDWCMRFRQKNWKVMFVPSVRVTHVKGVSSGSRPLFVEWHKHKGMMRFYRKFFRQQYPGILMGLITAGVWLRFSLVVVYYTIRRIVNIFRPAHG